MGYHNILYEVAEGIATITLNRPDRRNAVSPAMIEEIVDALDRADADDAVRVVIFAGAGKVFCAGADLSEGDKTFDYAAQGMASPIRADGSIDYAHPAVRDGAGLLTLRIYRCLKPVVGAVHGAAVGVGVTMLLPMDLRIAAEGTRFGFVFTRRGIVPEGASTWFLPRLVGMGTAADWMLSGRLFPAEEARDKGLVATVTGPEGALAAARAWAAEVVAQTAPVSVALTRQMLWRMAAADHPMAAHRLDSRGVYVRGRQADAREGVTAFLEKRPAVFPDRVSADMPDYFPWWDEPPYS